MFIRILFCVLLGLTLHAGLALAKVEIYSAGTRFNSFEDYKKSLTEAGQSQPEVSMSDVEGEKLSRLSYNHGIEQGVMNFDQKQKNSSPAFTLGAEDLEYAIQEAIGHQQTPALLISDAKKLRIMSYNSQDQLTLGEDIQGIDKTFEKQDN